MDKLFRGSPLLVQILFVYFGAAYLHLEAVTVFVAVIIAIGIMLFASKPLTQFVNAHPTVVILCLGFLLTLGFALVAVGFGFAVPKGYLYAAITFSVMIETLNQLARRNVRRADQRRPLRERTAEGVLEKGGQLVRSAGTSAQLMAKEGRYAQVRMPSGEMRFVDVRCRATVGEVGNAEQSNINWGKAGRMRWKGKRPTVRGVVMNPVDHPHGGGEGKTSGGRHPVSPWGKPEGRTRKRKASDALIVRRRRTGKKR